MIDSKTTIQTDPAITRNGETGFGRIYRGSSQDGTPATYFFGATDSFDTSSGFNTFFNDTAHLPMAAFKFNTLQIAGWEQEFGNYVNSIIPGISVAQAGESARTEVQPVKDAVNNVGVKRPTLAYSNIKTAASAMGTMAKLIADAASKANPSKYPNT